MGVGPIAGPDLEETDQFDQLAFDGFCGNLMAASGREFIGEHIKGIWG